MHVSVHLFTCLLVDLFKLSFILDLNRIDNRYFKFSFFIYLLWYIHRVHDY